MKVVKYKSLFSNVTTSESVVMDDFDDDVDDLLMSVPLTETRTCTGTK